MSLMKKIGLLVAALGFVSTASADILLEPYLGYYMGKYKASSSTDMSGLGYGARVGYQQLGFMVGLDYMTGKWTDKAKPSNDVTPSSFGVFVGYNFPILLRVYGAYGFSNSLKFEQGGSTAKNEGTPRIKLGVGYTALPLVAINLEYITGTYDEVNGRSRTTDLTETTYGVNVSVPFAF